MTDTMDTRGNISQQRERGRETEMVRGQKKTHRKQNTEQAGKEQATSAKVDTVEDTTANNPPKNSLEEANWTELPLCHFTWNLKIGVDIDCEKVIRDIAEESEIVPHLLGIEALLFRAYLEVLENRKCCDVNKARQSIDKADKRIEQTDERLRKGYKVVSLLNRMWIENKCLKTQKVKELRAELAGYKLEGNDLLVIGAVQAAALIRLGPNVYASALDMFEGALQQFPKNVDFLYGAALVTGMMGRNRRSTTPEYKNLDSKGKELLDKQKTYLEKIMESKNNYPIVKSDLGQNLFGRADKREREKGVQYLEGAYNDAKEVHQVVLNLVRYYKWEKKYDLAIKTLQERNGQDYHESHYQLALCFVAKAKNIKKKTTEKKTPRPRDTTQKCSTRDNIASAEKCGRVKTAQSPQQTVRQSEGCTQYKGNTVHAVTHRADSKSEQPSDEWYRKALKELETCLELNKGHKYATISRCEVMRALSPTRAKTIFEDSIQQSEKWPTENKLDLYFKFAAFLEQNKERESGMNMWQQVMDLTASFEFLDETSCIWEVEEKAKSKKEQAYSKLRDHYKRNSLRLGILHFQNFEFEEAEKILEMQPEHDRETNADIPRYLALTYLKMGSQRELQALSQERQPEETKEIFEKAHDNAIRSMNIGLSQMEGRKLRADTALAIAHNQLLLVGFPGTEKARHLPSASTQSETESRDTTTPDLNSPYILSYREAVRCGSLVASLELLRLIKNNIVKETPRSKFLQILAEIDVCCSLERSDHVHREGKPLIFDKGLSSRNRDKDARALNCKAIKRDVTAILHQEKFYRQAWKEHFIMERAILQKRFENNEGKLELDGEDEEKRATFSEEIVWAACDSCEKLRPLLDRIVYRFGTKERDIEEKSMKNQYFPLIDDRTPMEEVPGKLENELKLIFGTDMKKHYSKLVEELLKEQTQPGNHFLRTCRELVNTIKHGDISSVSEIFAITEDPVTLARQCTDKMEEICNFFFKAMDKASDLRDQVKQLVSDINEKADELLELLSDNDQFVVTKGSTWKLLEMTALIRRRKRQSRSPDSEAEEALRKLTEGPQVECHNLRRHHQEVEDAVLENHEDGQISAKCRKTCKEAVKALDAGLAEHKSYIGDTETLECLDILGIRKFQLKTKLQKMKIRADKAEELAETITQQEQRFISKENYDFSDVKKFLTTGGGEDKPSKVLDLTRWCTDSTEKILLAMRSCSPRTTSVTNRPKQNRKK